jgi:hypothetical protein
MALTLSNLCAASPAGPHSPIADRAAPGGFTARPRTLAERLVYLEWDATRILARPEAHRPEERSWAEDMIERRHVPPAGNGTRR